MGILDILKQYSNPGTTPSGDVVGHFDSVAQQASPQDLGSGIAAALRSDATPALGQTLGNLFAQSNPNQKAGVLNEILQTLGPAGLATAGGGDLVIRFEGFSADDRFGLESLELHRVRTRRASSIDQSQRRIERAIMVDARFGDDKRGGTHECSGQNEESSISTQIPAVRPRDNARTAIALTDLNAPIRAEQC